MNRFAHAAFLLTALAPLSAVFGVNKVLVHKWESTFSDLLPIVISIALIVACRALLRFALNRIENQKLVIRSAKSIDRELLPFLVAYVLPLATNNTVAVNGNVVTITIVTVLAVVLALRSHLSVVNPVVSLLGYRFYEVQADNGITFVLLSRSPLLSVARALDVHQVFDLVFVTTERAER